MSMDYIRRTYKVPARRGDRVIAYGKPGIILGARGAHLRILLDGERHVGCYHPADGIEYLQSPAAPNPATAHISACISRCESGEIAQDDGNIPDEWEHDGGAAVRLRFGDSWYRCTVRKERPKDLGGF